MKKASVVLLALAFVAALGLLAQTVGATPALVQVPGEASVDIDDVITGTGSGPGGGVALDFGRILPDALVTIPPVSGGTPAGAGWIMGGSGDTLAVHGTSPVTITPTGFPDNCGDPLNGVTLTDVTVSDASVALGLLLTDADVYVGGTLQAVAAAAGPYTCAFTIDLDYS